MDVVVVVVVAKAPAVADVVVHAPHHAVDGVRQSCLHVSAHKSNIEVYADATRARAATYLPHPVRILSASAITPARLWIQSGKHLHAHKHTHTHTRKLVHVHTFACVRASCARRRLWLFDVA